MDIRSGLKRLEEISPLRSFGRITQVVGLIAEAQGIKASLGSVCEIVPDDGLAEPVSVEVVGFRNGTVLLMPYAELRGIKPGSLVQNAARPPVFPVGRGYLGRTIDSFGSPLDEAGAITPEQHYPLYGNPPSPLNRPRVKEPMDVGIRSINSLLTLGKGQRIGIMSGSGVGKSTLMGMMARFTRADVNVIALVGERGREVLEFIESALGPEGMAKSVLVVATSDQSPLLRMRAAYAATAMAEFFRDQGQDVILMMDSVTRFATASREIGLAVGEPPSTRGYTPSVFAQMPKLLERAGRTAQGSITGIYTVLVEGDDFNEPVADAVRSILDGHIVLTRELADQGHYPSIDVLQSVSRLRPDVSPNEAVQHGNRVVSWLATYRRVQDMVNIGAYVRGSSREIDTALDKLEPISRFLTQEVEEPCDLESSLAQLAALM